MDEIKFRAWEPIGKTMYSPAFPTWNGDIEVWKDNIPQTEVIRLSPIADFEPILMQYTGLKDGKRTEESPEGQDIYEGDIVHVWDKTCCPDETLNFAAAVTHKYAQFGFDAIEEWTQLAICTCTDIKYEVIKNIWDNPELLEGGK